MIDNLFENDQWSHRISHEEGLPDDRNRPFQEYPYLLAAFFALTLERSNHQ